MQSSSAFLDLRLPPASEPELATLPGISAGTWIANLLAIILPFLAVIAAIVLLWGPGFSWLQLGLLVGMYSATAIGVTVGFHRLLTHRAFETIAPIKGFFAILGSMAVQGPVLDWVAIHRRHHQHSDRPDDPHSPHQHGEGFWGLIRGIWHSHVGWLFDAHPANLVRYIGDFREDRLIQFVNRSFVLWVAMGLLLPAIIGGLVTMTWMGALLGLIWGGLVRVFLVHHVTWSINSACHIWGSRPFRCGDHSRNNFIFGVLAWGEGWHNNHHAFPTSARHGLRWWEFDASYLVIRLLKLFGLAWEVRQPSRETIAQKLAAQNAG
ncbi:MAG TPA: fatty acid desaturase [Phycisphaerae bacterium]|nr:fatty acid desaturase [Phycisphaerae bacterium]